MKLLRYIDLKSKGITFSRVHLSRLEAAGRFPKRLHLNGPGGAISWLEHEIDQYIEQRAAERAA